MSPRNRRLRVGLAAIVVVCGLTAASPAPAIGPGDPPQSFTYARSDNGGADFSFLELANATPDAEQTHVEALDGRVHALYNETGQTTQHRRLFYRRSTDDGATFGPAVRMDQPRSGASTEVGDSGESDIEADGSNVYA
ncbi:MAG: hypothetical protein ACRDV9_04640, partial [Acidimicrobiia bacterium]